MSSRSTCSRRPPSYPRIDVDPYYALSGSMSIRATTYPDRCRSALRPVRIDVDPHRDASLSNPTTGFHDPLSRRGA